MYCSCHYLHVRASFVNEVLIAASAGKRPLQMSEAANSHQQRGCDQFQRSLGDYRLPRVTNNVRPSQIAVDTGRRLSRFQPLCGECWPFIFNSTRCSCQQTCDKKEESQRGSTQQTCPNFFPPSQTPPPPPPPHVAVTKVNNNLKKKLN